MIVGMAWLGALCVGLGVAPGYAIRLLDAPTSELLHGPGASAVVTARGPLVLSVALTPAGTNATAISMTMIAALFIVLAAMAWVLRRGLRRDSPRLAPTWTCGMSPTAPYIVRRIHYAGEIVDLAETHIYRRVEREISAFAQTIRARSTGRIYGYIGFVLGALFVALLLTGVIYR